MWDSTRRGVEAQVGIESIGSAVGAVRPPRADPRSLANGAALKMGCPAVYSIDSKKSFDHLTHSADSGIS